jgi:hypothetical protein
MPYVVMMSEVVVEGASHIVSVRRESVMLVQ